MYHTKLICIHRGEGPEGKSATFKDGCRIDFAVTNDGKVIAELRAPGNEAAISSRMSDGFTGKWGPFKRKETKQEYYVKISVRD